MDRSTSSGPAWDPPFPVTMPPGSPGQVPGAGEAPGDGLHGWHTAGATRGHPQKPPITSKFWKHPPGKALMAWGGRP